MCLFYVGGTQVSVYAELLVLSPKDVHTYHVHDTSIH